LLSSITDDALTLENNDERSPIRENAQSTDMDDELPEMGRKFSTEPRVRVLGSLTNATVALDTAKKDNVRFVAVETRKEALHALENDQGLLVHTPPRMGVPTASFYKDGSKDTELRRSSSSSAPDTKRKIVASVPANSKPRPSTFKELQLSKSKEPVRSIFSQPWPHASRIPLNLTSRRSHPCTSKQRVPSASKEPMPLTYKIPKPCTSKELHPLTSREPVPSTSKVASKNVSESDIAISDETSDSDSFIDDPSSYGYSEPRRKRRRKAWEPRRVWTNHEEGLVYQGVKTYGVGRWALIHAKYLPGRSNIDIKDKWRTMLRQGRIKELERRFGPL